MEKGGEGRAWKSFFPKRKGKTANRWENFPEGEEIMPLHIRGDRIRILPL